MSMKNMEARVGFEPTNGGFADLSLGPLGYRATAASQYSEKFEIPSCAGVPADSFNRRSLRGHGGDVGLAKKLRGFLGRRRADIEAGAPLESGHLR